MSAGLDPFLQMADTLARARPSRPRLPALKDRRRPAATRTDQIRQLVRISGPLSARAIALQLDLERPDLVSALLKVDLQRERVRRIGRLYEWNHSYDDGLARELDAVRRGS